MWSRKFYKCINCNTTKIKHVAKGLCLTCYTLQIESEHKKHKRHKRGVADDFLTKENLFELYVEKGMSLTDIGKLAGCTRVNVHYKLKKYGIDARSKMDARTLALDKGKIKTTRIDDFGNEEIIVFQKIRYNNNFFKKWSTEMAYVLGLIYTDGNLHIRKASSGYETGILTFAQKDKELVEKFLGLMDCNATIRYRKRREMEKTTAGELYYFSIGNNDLANDLIRLGVTPNKSLEMQFPNIPDEFLRHFVRGLFDGDGSVYIERKSIRVKLLSGCRKFVEELNSFMRLNGLSNRKIDYSNSIESPGAFFIRYNSVSDIMLFHQFIYDGVSITNYYSRKKDIFDQYFHKCLIK